MFLNKDKKPCIKEQVLKEGGYIKFDNAIVLEKKEGCVELPEGWIYGYGELGKTIILKAEKDNGYNKLIKIPHYRWKELGYKLRGEAIIKYGPYMNKNSTITNYDFIEVGNELTVNQVNILQKALGQVVRDLEVPDKLVDVKVDTNKSIKPSEFVGDFLLKEYEGKEIVFSDELGVILDLENLQNNISSSNVFDAIYRYVDKNIVKLNKILNKLGIVGIEESDVYYIYDVNANTRVEFRKDGVFLIKSNADTEVETLLIDKPLKLEGFFTTNFDIFTRVFTDTEYKYYKFENDIIFPYFENVDKFNKKLGARGIRMMGGGKYLQLLYSALDKWIEDDEIRQLEIIETNGIDLQKKVFVHGGKILYNDGYCNDYITFAEKYAIQGGVNIKLEEAKNILDGYLKKPYQHILFLRFLGAFLKKDLFKIGIPTPLMLIIGFTESGKTELVHTIMKLFGYSVVPIREGNITLQPRTITLEGSGVFAIQKKLGDYTPVFFDEFTGNVKPEVEELFRAVYNEKDTEKGRADQTVVKYKMVSPIVIGGEKAPSYLSVLNRSIYLQLDKSYQTDKATYLKIKRQLEGKVVLEDMRNRIKNVDLSKYRYLADKGEARVENNYNWLRIVNDIYGGLYTEAELDEMINTAINLQQKILTGHNELKKFFTTLLIWGKKEKTIAMFYEGSGEERDLIIDIYIPESEQQKNHAILKLKELVGDETRDMNGLKINFSKLMREKREETRWVVNDIIRYLRKYQDYARKEYLTANIFCDEDI